MVVFQKIKPLYIILDMFKAIISFFTKAAPRFVGEMMKPGKGVVKMFAKYNDALNKSKFGKAATSFLGKTPGEFMKECGRDALKTSAINAMVRGAGGLFSGGSPKQYRFPSKSAGNVIGGGKAPGIQQTQAAQASTAQSYNRASRLLSAEASKQAALKKKQKKVIDRYRKNIQRKNWSVAEITSLSNQLETDLKHQKETLTAGLKTGKHTPDGLRAVKPSRGMKPPARVPAEQKELATYTQEALEEMNAQLQENIKTVNDNVNKSIAEMVRKEEETAAQMMANLGNYNTITYKKLADTVTKTEEVSFKKQQESAYYQTEVIADKLDSSHDYNTKQLEAVRSEVLTNTQSMYELDKQNRMIEENYRALEDRKNNGFTLATLGALLTQTHRMVQSSLKTPDIINDNVNNAMRSVAFTAGEELGKLIQIAAELVQGIRAMLASLYKKFSKNWVIGNILGGTLNALDWGYDKIFRGLLGVEDSVIGDVFGKAGSLQELQQEKEDEEYDGGIADQRDTQKSIERQGDTVYRSSGGKFDVRKQVVTQQDLISHNYKIDEKKKELTFMTNTGYQVKLKHDQGDDESSEAYKRRKVAEAIDLETAENFFYDEAQGSVPSRYSKEEARANLNTCMKLIEGVHIKKQKGSGTQKYTMDYIYDVVGAEGQSGTLSWPHSEPPAVEVRDGSLHNLKRIIADDDNLYIQAWHKQGDELSLKGGLKIRLQKAFKEAAAKGIKFKVTSTFRAPSAASQYLSPHHLGIAVDVIIEGLSAAVEQWWNIPGEVNRDLARSQGYIVILTAEDLDGLINKTNTKEGMPADAHDLFVQWGEWQQICSNNELSVGVHKYYKAAEARGVKNGTRRLDMVHIQVAGTAIEIDEFKMASAMIMQRSMADIQGYKYDQVLEKGLGKYEKAKAKEILEDLFADNPEAQISAGPKGFQVIYNDPIGMMPMNAKDYELQKDGTIVPRKTKDKNIKTSAGWGLYDKIQNGEITKEKFEEIKKDMEAFDKLTDAEKKVAKRGEYYDDVRYMINNNDIINNVVTSTPSEMSTGDQSNIPQ